MSDWYSWLDHDEIVSRVLTAYKLRIDDAYAAVGMLRGLNKESA